MIAARARALVYGSTRADRSVVALLSVAAGLAAGGVIVDPSPVVAVVAVGFAAVVGAGKQTAA